jgi:hypothetical protein
LGRASQIGIRRRRAAIILVIVISTISSLPWQLLHLLDRDFLFFREHGELAPKAEQMLRGLASDELAALLFRAAAFAFGPM